MLAAAALLCAAPAANAQKVNDAALKSKAAKSDSDIQDAKKAAKAEPEKKPAAKKKADKAAEAAPAEAPAESAAAEA